MDSYMEMHAQNKSRGIHCGFFQLKFGTDAVTGGKVIRSGLSSAVFCVFHLNNDTAKHVSSARKCLLNMLKRCLRYQVDFIFGDGSTAVNRFRPSGNNLHFDRLNALVPSLLREAFSSYHVGMELGRELESTLWNVRQRMQLKTVPWLPWLIACVASHCREERHLHTKLVDKKSRLPLTSCVSRNEKDGIL